MRKAGRGAGVCGTWDTGPRPRGRGVLRVYSGSGVEGRAGAQGEHPVWGRGRAEGAPVGRTGERGAPARCQPRRSHRALSRALRGSAGAMDRGRGKRSLCGRTCCCPGWGRENRAI